MSVIAVEWKESRGESLSLRRVSAERLFSFFLQLDGSWQNRLTEEPQQSLEILCRCCQEELLAHELQSPQAQATQPDLVLQFREQGLDSLSLPLGASELRSVHQLTDSLPGGLMRDVE